MNRAKQLILLAGLIFFIYSCGKKDNTGTAADSSPVYVPTLITTGVFSVTTYGAQIGASISDSSGSFISARGVCYSKSPGPTVSDNVVYAGDDSDYFLVTLTNLDENNIYYVRAFATNGTGTGYGNQMSFKTTYAIGQFYKGGIIFYVDNRGQHGLIVAPEDIGGGPYPWGCAGTLINGASGKLLGEGVINTGKIVGTGGCMPGVPIAASVCDTSVINGYADWFLPSYDELHLMFLQKRAIGNFSDTFYWSSTQVDKDKAYYENFAIGGQFNISKSTVANVRPIRAF